MYLLALKEGKAFFLIGYRMYAFALAMHKGCVSHCLVKLQERKMKSLSRVWLLRPHGLYPTRLLRPWDFPGKNTWVGCHFLLQEIFLPQGLNPGLPHCRQMIYCLSPQGSLKLQSCAYKAKPVTFLFSFHQSNYKCFLMPSLGISKKAHAIFQVESAAAAAKSLQSCSTLCGPIGSSPPGSPVPGILQARTLEWVAISFSNAVESTEGSYVRLV